MRTCSTCGAVWDDAYDFCSFDGGALVVITPGSRVIGERYLLEQRIAAGAMGVVFRATHLQLGSTVAVKLMQPQTDELVVGLLRFHREGQILGQIKHPNAVLVMDFGVEERESESLPYLVTEYLRGEGLDVRFARQGAMSLTDVVEILVPLCEAVHEAHEVGVIHRDVKPSNVFLESLRDGSTVVKVLDFGIAKFVEVEPAVLARKREENAAWALRCGKDGADFLDEVARVRRAQSEDREDIATKVSRVSSSPLERGDSSPPRVHQEKPRVAAPATVTEAGFMIGTIPYMAPEQMTGERVSRQTDIYAIATLAFQLLTGVLPFEGDDDAIIQLKLTSSPPSANQHGADIPPALDRALQKALAVDARDRGDGALELAKAFEEAAPKLTPDDDTDPELSLSIAVGALAGVMSDITVDVRTLEAEVVVDQRAISPHYASARDRLLAIAGSLTRILLSGGRMSHGGVSHGGIPSVVNSESRTQLEGVAVDLSVATRELNFALNQLGAQSEAGEFLRALWLRTQIHVDKLQTILGKLVPNAAAAVPVLRTAAAPPNNPFAVVERSDLSLLVTRLEKGDDLDAEDAFDDLLSNHLDWLREVLRQHDDGALIRGLWRHADKLLLRELFESNPPRVLALIAGLTSKDALGFSILGALFGNIDATANEAKESRAIFLESQDAPRPSLAKEERDDESTAARIFDRCLLLHPSDEVRDDAMARTELSSVWSLLLSGQLPVAVMRQAFARAIDEASDEFLKVFFLCAKDTLASSDDTCLRDAFSLMRLFFSVECFHEDVVFEPLLELDLLLTARARAVGFNPNKESEQASPYADVTAAFAAGGARETRLESLREIPLAVQRKLARDGHFVERFMTHPLDKVALETVPHLVRREDVVRFVRVPTIHRVVITELAKVRRLFRKEQARLALLQNPKTPANVARIYLPLLPHVQVQNLSRNKHIGAEVRALARTFAEKLAMRTEIDREM